MAKLTATVEELQGILADESKIQDILEEELLEIKRKFGDERRTELVAATEEIDLEDLIERHTCVITVSHTGYIKRMPATTYTAQNRGGKGIIGMTTKDEDWVEDVIVANSHSLLMMFTNKGRVYTKKVYRIPEASRTAKGTSIANILELGDGEHLTAIVAIAQLVPEEYLTMITRKGVIKRTQLSAFTYQRKSGKIAISLDEGDELLFVHHTNGDKELVLATSQGNAVRFSEKEVRVMGRTARGVRGIRLHEDDYVVGVSPVEEGKSLLTLTEQGMGKRTEFDDFRSMKNRGGQGVCCHKLTDKSGVLASIAAVSEDDDIMIITANGTIIRTPVANIPTYSRTAGGVIVMRLSQGDKIQTFAKLEKDEDIEKEAESIEAQGDLPSITEAEEGAEDVAEAVETAEPEEGDEE